MENKMVLPETYRLRFGVASWLVMFLTVTTGCSPEQTAFPNATTPTSLPLVTATVQCEQELVPPQITEVLPAQAIPGGEITVIGSGGYLRDTCGGYVEGSKVFKLYLNNEPIGDLSCYVNHCEGKLTLPSTVSIGSHCLSVELNKCQFEFQTTTK
jgi:hypothetical protein